jgi:protoporphyrinogen IX oxidase
MVAWTLVFHIIGMVFWLGSLLAVTHTLAIHTEESAPEARAALGRLELKLLRGLAHPGAAIMVITGFILIGHDPNLLRQHWLHAKLLLVVNLIALDLRVSFRARAFQEGKIAMTRGECMGLHGAIALLFVLIAILALVRPFGPPRQDVRQGRMELGDGLKVETCSTLRHLAGKAAPDGWALLS